MLWLFRYPRYNTSTIKFVPGVLRISKLEIRHIILYIYRVIVNVEQISLLINYGALYWIARTCAIRRDRISQVRYYDPRNRTHIPIIIYNQKINSVYYKILHIAHRLGGSLSSSSKLLTEYLTRVQRRRKGINSFIAWLINWLIYETVRESRILRTNTRR